MTERTVMRKKVLIKWLFVLTACVACSFYAYDVMKFKFYENKHRKPLRTKYTIETSACKIPHLQLRDESIISLLNDTDMGYSCGDKRAIVSSNATALFFDRAGLRDHGYEASQLDCGYRPFWRVDPARDDEDDTIVKFGNRTRIVTDARVEDEFVRVDCRPTGGGSVVFTEFYSFVPATKWARVERNDRLWSVAIIGLDSLSRMHVRRTMPRTVEALRAIGATEMLGYNKVEDNTFPNLVPLLSGSSWLELMKDCWPSYRARFDKCRFIFHDFRRAGYLTAWAEERSDFGIFNYLKKGWAHQPVDVYWNTFDEEARRQVGHIYQFNYPDCYGSRPAYVAALEHTERVMSGGVASGRPFFTFTWITTLAHNHYGTAALADDHVAEFVSKLASNGLLDRTVLLFLSDHGYRWGAIPQTQQGHLENRLPFMFWRLPPGFAATHPEAAKHLSENAHRLVTTYDVHATLHHLLGDADRSERSISLFTPIPESRTCDSADIPAHYCTCFEPLPVDVDQPEVKTAADLLLEHINGLVSGHACSTMSLGEIRSAGLVAAGDPKAGQSLMTRDYTLTLKLDPNGILVSGTVRFSGDVMRVAGTVGRLDRYGDQSRCVSDPTLKLYCQCVS